MIKSVSFDVWGTLVKKNPEFSIHQEKLVKEFVFIDDWKGVKEKAKIIIKENELKGIHTDRVFVYKNLLPSLSIKQIENFIDYSNELFLKYPPIVPQSSRDLVSYFKEQDVRCYVSSNTALVYGDVISKIIYNEFGIIKSNCKFSDGVGVCKPSEEMFQFPIKPLFHIGDNIITDGASEKFGVKYLHYSIKDNTNLNKFFENAKV